MVEMLAVLAIVALMLFVGMPVFQSFSVRGMTAATSGVATTLRLARQYAVTKRTDVWVVFPDGRGSYNRRSEIRKAAVSYAVIASNRTTGKREYISEWKYLPKGLTFITNPKFGGEHRLWKLQFRRPTTEFPFPTDDTNSDPEPVRGSL